MGKIAEFLFLGVCSECLCMWLLFLWRLGIVLQCYGFQDLLAILSLCVPGVFFFLSGGRSCRYLDGKAGWAFFGGGLCGFRDADGSRNGLDQKQKLHGAEVHRDFPGQEVGKQCEL